MSTSESIALLLCIAPTVIFITMDILGPTKKQQEEELATQARNAAFHKEMMSNRK